LWDVLGDGVVANEPEAVADNSVLDEGVVAVLDDLLVLRVLVVAAHDECVSPGLVATHVLDEDCRPNVQSDVAWAEEGPVTHDAGSQCEVRELDLTLFVRVGLHGLDDLG